MVLLSSCTAQWAGDNDAAEALWNSMGSRADVLTNQILREGGDYTRVFHAGSLSDDSLAFGETPWNLSDQARFASNLRCIADHQSVVNAMAALNNGHDYGLGLIPGAIFKGGWSG
ncbi:hypothetical protein GSS87_06565 [Corynebacterium sp. 4HC-13]|uniref:hypothetical protein n=1 Tax=Corynebacterium anserum TaxID=2684406 RepID=UPI00163A6C72|nr:hypothetical protein [Corynebacterium anserum]MBC2682056.1 hypothetical protein [Corynebacterium anserum]